MILPKCVLSMLCVNQREKTNSSLDILLNLNGLLTIHYNIMYYKMFIFYIVKTLNCYSAIISLYVFSPEHLFYEDYH